MVTRSVMTVRPDDPELVWCGAVDVRHTPQWSQAWRLPHDQIGLFHDENLRSCAGMATGVRIRFITDSSIIAGRSEPADDWTDLTPMDLVVNGEVFGSVLASADGRFAFDVLPDGEKTIELWLPQYGTLRLNALELSDGATLRPAEPVGGPRLVTYGSSITQCRAAASPTQTWPAIVARQLGLDLTCLGFGGQCHLDSMVARVIRDLPADVIIACVGINIYGGGTLNKRSFLPAILGFMATVRDGHPGIPILVISPIHSPSREAIAGPGGMTLAEMRAEVAHAVELLRDHGDDDTHLLDGNDVLGPDKTDMLFDGVHPDNEGYRMMANAIAPEIDRILTLRPDMSSAR